MNTIEALQTLYVALGGTLSDTYEGIANGAPVSDYNVIPDMIAAIAEKVPTGKSLPTVTADDNGKVLKVIDGAWGVGTDATE